MATSFDKYKMPFDLWVKVFSLLPRQQDKKRGGRPPIHNLKSIADGIFYKLRTGCQWNAIPRCFGASSTIHNYFQKWVEQGVFEKIWELALKEYDELVGIAWQHQSLDTAIVKAPHGGEKNRTKPDRSQETWVQTLRPGGRAWRATILRTRSRKQA